MRKRIWILLLVMVLLSAGCSGQKQDSGKTDIAAGEEAAASFLPEGQIYTAQWGESFQCQDLLASARLVLTERVLYYAQVNRDESSGEFQTELYRWAEGKTAEKLYTLENAYAHHLLSDGQGYLYCIYSDRSEEGAEMSPVRLLKLDLDGEPIYDEPVRADDREDSGEEVTWLLTDAVVTEAGQICACDSDGTVYFFDEAGKWKGTAKASAGGTGLFSDYGLVNAGEAGCYWYTWEQNTLTCQKLSLESGTIGKAESLSMENAYAGIYDGENGILIKSGTSLSLYTPGQGEPAEMLRWSDRAIGVNPVGIENLSMEEDGGLTCLFYRANGNGYLYEWLSLEQGEVLPEADSDSTIRLGVVGSIDEIEMDFLKGVFNEFYKLYPDYNVEVVTYDMGWTEFALDLLKGKGPDLISTQFLDVDMLTDKGILEDLTPYLEVSGKVGTEDLLPSVLRAMTVNGKLVRVIDEIMIWGNIVAAGTTDGGAWTPEEYLALADQQTSGVYMSVYMGNWDLYSDIMNRAMYSYVDWEKRECHFTDGSFARLLERIMEVSVEDTGLSLRDQGEVSYYRSGQVLMVRGEYLHGVRGIWYIKEAFGDEAEFAGYPNYERTPQYEMSARHEWGINSASDKKEIAWALLEMILSKDYQVLCRSSAASSELFLPVRNDVMTEELDGVYDRFGVSAAAVINPYTKEKHYYPDGIPALNEEEKEEIRYVVDNGYIRSPVSGVIHDIASEEVQAFFAGDKTADEVAEIIQNRVSLYLNE